MVEREREMLTFVVILFNKLDMRRSLGSPPLNYGIVARICSNWFFFLFHQNFWKNREEQPRVVVSLILIPRDSHAKVGNKIPLNCECLVHIEEGKECDPLPIFF